MSFFILINIVSQTVYKMTIQFVVETFLQYFLADAVAGLQEPDRKISLYNNFTGNEIAVISFSTTKAIQASLTTAHVKHFIIESSTTSNFYAQRFTLISILIFYLEIQ